MANSESAFNEFESLWQKAITRQEDQQVVEIKEVDTDFSLLSLLQQLSSLADKLESSDLIDGSQHDQMQTAITNLKEVIDTVDAAVLSEALKSLN